MSAPPSANALYRKSIGVPCGKWNPRLTAHPSESAFPLTDSRTSVRIPSPTTSYSKRTPLPSLRTPRNFASNSVPPLSHVGKLGKLKTRSPSKSQMNFDLAPEYGGPHKSSGPPFQ